MIKQNYCEVKKNKLYAEIYDELLDEELNMNKQEHNDKIKNWIKKKVCTMDNFVLVDNYDEKQEIMTNLILKIQSSTTNENLQGNTIILYADDNYMYEVFYMEDLTRKTKMLDDDLNEFGSLSNIHLEPIYWTCGIFKSTYSNGLLKESNITLNDVANLFIYNFYHTGVMIEVDGRMIEIEFSGEDPFKMIGNTFVLSKSVDIMGFSIIPYFEKASQVDEENKVNKTASKLFGYEIKNRVFITLLCPTTNKKYWNIYSKTINNILTILDNKQIEKNDTKQNSMQNQDLNDNSMYFNPFYDLTKLLTN